MTEQANVFIQSATVFFSVMVGLLATLPLAITNQQGMGTIIVLVGLLLGLAVGIRRRTSRFFFYVSLVATLVLSSVVYSNLIGS